MAKWFGTIGYSNQQETSPGVWEEIPVEKNYYGDLISNTRNLQNTSEINDQINISNTISIISEPYALNNFTSILYVTYLGKKWKVKNVSVEYPRLLLTIGGLYNEQ